MSAEPAEPLRLPTSVEPLEYEPPQQTAISAAAWYGFGVFAGLFVSVGLGFLSSGIAYGIWRDDEAAVFVGFGLGAFSYGLLLFALPLTRMWLLHKMAASRR